MFELAKEFTFEASHELVHHDGKCARLHGHTYKVVIIVRGDKLQEDGPKCGMVIDFGVLSALCKDLHEALDHRHLNTVLGVDSPTAERLAIWIYEYAACSLTAVGARGLLSEVVVHETATSAVRYFG